MERDVARVVGRVRSSHKGLLIKSLDFTLRAVTFNGAHCGVSICVLEELLQLRCEG